MREREAMASYLIKRCKGDKVIKKFHSFDRGRSADRSNKCCCETIQFVKHGVFASKSSDMTHDRAA